MAIEQVAENADIIENSMIKESLRSFDTSLWKNLLCDRTTGRNIIWGTDEYSPNGYEFSPEQEITLSSISGRYADIIRPRVHKSTEEQIIRTRKHAEVFTPSWLCNRMNNTFDEAWFGRADVFSTIFDNTWRSESKNIVFPDDKKRNWQAYVDSRRLEITCGEAPFLVSRYDTVSGDKIDIPHRIGILDRKLRVVSENTDSETEWLKWAYRAFESVYGFEFQGDNLLIARINLLLTFAEYLEHKWDRQPNYKELRDITRIISWNLWQMDGLTDTVPLGIPEEPYEQMTLFDFEEEQEPENVQPLCRIMDWRAGKSIEFASLKEKGWE